MMTEQGRVLEKLLAGDFICQTSDPDGYRFLALQDNAEAIESHLSILNRRLARTADQQVFFCAYQSLGEDERRHLGQQFRETSGSLLPLVEWLVLVQEATGDNAPLSQGAIVRLNQLQSAIEDTPAFSEQLARIAQYPLFNSSSAAIDAQLKQVFKRLVELRYLLKPNAEKQIFVATGKIDYLFEVIKFIDEAENLSLQSDLDDAQQQGDLL